MARSLVRFLTALKRTKTKKHQGKRREFYGTREQNRLKQKSSRNEIRYDYSIWLRRQDSNFKFVKHLEYSVHFRILISFF
jgi:hypothetical protein